MIRRILFIIIVILQVTFLLGMVVVKQREMDTGFPVRLSVQPIDPHDLTRGEYVQLGYNISNLDLTKISHEPGVYIRNSVTYVTLTHDTVPNSELWIPKYISRKQPPSSSFPFIEGRVLWNNQWSDPSTKFNELRMDYSIGQYYVQEGRAKEVESAMGPWAKETTRRVSAEIRLSKNGKANVAKIFIDNKEYK